MPHYIISRLAYKVANCEITWIKNLLIQWFIKYYQVNLQEAALEKPTDYPNFDDFFVRELKSSARPIATESNAIISPVDGIISQCGKITAGKIIQAKGKNFSVINLVGAEGQNFVDGDFITLYLSPKDYHRVHMPVTGILDHMRVFPGRLFSVQPKVVEKVNALYTRNERVVSFFTTDFGPLAVVLVGAIVVGSIAMQWEGVVVQGGKNISKTEYNYHGNEIEVTQGSEIGQFRFGSTVILLFPKDKVGLNVTGGTPVKMGQRLGIINL